MRTWHIVTPEYPPDVGGVADYSALVASGLREAGEIVHVWCRSSSGRTNREQDWVHPEGGSLGPAGLVAIGRGLDRFPGPRKLLVQWVPHGYGFCAMNLPLCLWVLFRALRGDEIEIMLHEAFLPFRGGTWRQSAAATVQRLMTIILFGATRRVWMSSPSWKPKLLPYSLGKDIRFTWLPIPSTIPSTGAAPDPELRAAYTPGGEPLIGHFGTYGRAMAEMLDRILPEVMTSNPDCKVLLIGSNSDSYKRKLAAIHPQLTPRLIATGTIDADTVARNLTVCDLMIQPYPEGVTARRTTCLAGLSHGKPVVTTTGDMTEQFWYSTPPPVAFGRSYTETAMVATSLLHNHTELKNLGERAKAYYRDNFAVEHLIRTLRLGVS